MKEARLAEVAARLPGRRIGRAEDIANAIAFLMGDDLVTGTVLRSEGGHLLVQDGAKLSGRLSLQPARFGTPALSAMFCQA